MTNSLTELFSIDPRSMSEKDIDEIIAIYRQQRAQYNLGAAPGSRRKPAEPTKVSAIDLKSLGLLDD